MVYGSGTPGPLSDWTLQVCCAQLLKKPEGRQDVVLIGSFFGTESHYKANWGSVQDEAYICRRRGILLGIRSSKSPRWTPVGESFAAGRLQPLACISCKTTPGVQHFRGAFTITLSEPTAIRIRLMAADDDDESSWHSAMDILEVRRESSSTASARPPHTDLLAADDSNTKKKKKKQKTQKPRSARSTKRHLGAQLQSQATRLNDTRQRVTKKSKKPSRRQHSSSQPSTQQDADSAQLDECSDDFQLDLNQLQDATTETLTARNKTKSHTTACAKMLVRARHRCACHFLIECPTALFQKPASLVFHPD